MWTEKNTKRGGAFILFFCEWHVPCLMFGRVVWYQMMTNGTVLVEPIRIDELVLYLPTRETYV